MELGTIGITCAKLSEAEVLVNAGITNVLIANQVVDPAEIKRLANLAGSCNIIVAVEQLENLLRIGEVAKAVGNTIHVVIEVDVGLHRAGVNLVRLHWSWRKKPLTLMEFISWVYSVTKDSPCLK